MAGRPRGIYTDPERMQAMADAAQAAGDTKAANHWKGRLKAFLIAAGLATPFVIGAVMYSGVLAPLLPSMPSPFASTVGALTFG